MNKVSAPTNEAWELFDFLGDVQFWVKDRRGVYLWVNRGFLMNYSLDDRAQVIGRTDFDLSPAHLADQYRLDDERVLAGERIINRVELVGRFDHTAAWSHTTKLPLHDKRGRITGSVGITHPAPASKVLPDSADAALAKAIAYIRRHHHQPIDNPHLAKLAGLSLRAFERRFVKAMHSTPQQYVRRLRVRLACRALVATSAPLADIAFDHGFCDQSHFTREFRRETGLTPREYRAHYTA
ncbi:MAG TPA: AraC family transcriptional regulator [Prosthecobacter sp.]|nr:AraC family transcriptional regulator [Prosthecobacter sp.]